MCFHGAFDKINKYSYYLFIKSIKNKFFILFNLFLNKSNFVMLISCIMQTPEEFFLNIKWI